RIERPANATGDHATISRPAGQVGAADALVGGGLASPCATPRTRRIERRVLMFQQKGDELTLDVITSTFQDVGPQT
ncbi:MAG: hypothetical protein WBN60_00560, partial [Polyangiales bacterium]